jgi:RHS repeat-associated protein
MTDGEGNVRQTYSYEPYGEVTSTGFSNNPYQYTGRENEDTGLYYYRARYYSPKLKHFISEDPIGLTAGPNAYAYVQNDPADEIDPYGLEGFPVGCMFTNCGQYYATPPPPFPPMPKLPEDYCGCAWETTVKMVSTKIRDKILIYSAKYVVVAAVQPEFAAFILVISIPIEVWYERWDTSEEITKYFVCLMECPDCE